MSLSSYASRLGWSGCNAASMQPTPERQRLQTQGSKGWTDFLVREADERDMGRQTPIFTPPWLPPTSTARPDTTWP